MKKIIILCVLLSSSINAMEKLSEERKRSSLIALLTLPHPYTVITARYNNDGTKVITTTKDGIVRIWDTQSRKIQQELSSLDYWLCLFRTRFTSADFSPDGRKILLPTNTEKTFIYDTETGQETSVLEKPWAGKLFSAPVNSATYNHRGTSVITTQYDGAYLWDLRIARLSHHFSLPRRWIIDRPIDSGTTVSADSNAEETLLAIASSTGMAYIYDTRRTNFFHKELDHDDAYRKLSYQADYSSSRPVTSLNFHPTNDSLVTTFRNGIFLWDIFGSSQKTYRCIEPVTAAAIDNNDRLVALCGKNLDILDDGTKSFASVTLDDSFNSIAFDQSRSVLVSSGRLAIAWEMNNIHTQ